MPLLTRTIANYVLLISLFVLDYIIGNGFVDITKRLICKIVCFTKKVIIEESKLASSIVRNENPISFPVMFTEVLLVTVTIVMLNKYKKYRCTDRLDELIKESKEALKQTNEFLDKWRMRRVHWQEPNEYSFLDEEHIEIQPLKVEIPILHMAIVDTLGATRSLEGGDVGDSANIDSAILSVTSIDEVESIPDPNIIEGFDTNDVYNRQLWNVMEDVECENA